MITGLFFSRAMLTGGTLLVFCSFFIGNDFYPEWRKPHMGYYMLLILLFLIPFVSGLWSNDLLEWWQRCSIKLPFVLLPFAFIMIFLKRAHYIIISILFILLVFTGSLTSFIGYLHNSSSIQAGYLESVLMKVWLNNDHVLFSWACVIAILMIQIIHPMIRPTSATYRVLGWLITGWFIFFLHVLAARTGLLCLYAVIFSWAIYKISGRFYKYGFLAIAAILLLPLVAFFVLPTFHNRMLYVLYDMQQYSRGNFPPGFSDVARIISYKGGFYISEHNLLTGVGFGDISESMSIWYDSRFPNLTVHDRILPHNEWLIYSCGTGIFALLIFSYIVLYPLFLKRQWYWIAFHLTALICFLTDATLETQNGTFLYCFFICWINVGIDKKTN
jgi:hypothetical protein